MYGFMLKRGGDIVDKIKLPKRRWFLLIAEYNLYDPEDDEKLDP